MGQSVRDIRPVQTPTPSRRLLHFLLQANIPRQKFLQHYSILLQQVSTNIRSYVPRPITLYRGRRFFLLFLFFACIAISVSLFSLSWFSCFNSSRLCTPNTSWKGPIISFTMSTIRFRFRSVGQVCDFISNCTQRNCQSIFISCSNPWSSNMFPLWSRMRQYVSGIFHCVARSMLSMSLW